MLLLASLALAAWLYLACFHGRFWFSGPELPATPATVAKNVAVIVPARNEEDSIERALRSLLVQNFAGEISVILIDDNSTDRTSAIAASLAAEHSNLIVLNEAQLPAGWSGKLWAVHQGLSHPLAQTADYVLLTDADIEHTPDHIARLVAKSESEGLELVSEMVHLHCSTFPERALIPAFIFFFQMLYPFRRAASSRSSIAAAAGGTILVARAALDRIDGVQRIRRQLIDDCALAREVKHSGGRIWLGSSRSTVSLRVYAHSSEIWNMIARTAFVQLHHSLLSLAGCILGMSLLYLVPPALALFAFGSACAIPRFAALAAWLLMSALFQPTLRSYRSSPLWGFALPLIALFYLCATIASAYRHYAGRGGNWKARTYPA
ncbi:MAG: glycosyltransferase [Terracidiphilus sp.]|nr:glycosyltransferase [Terracidiphilus sp.]